MVSALPHKTDKQLRNHYDKVIDKYKHECIEIAKFNSIESVDE